MPQYGYPRSDRLRKKAEYSSCYANGQRHFTRDFIVYVLPKEQGTGSRTGMAVSKKVGHAVVRNRIKRLLREFFRLHGRLFHACDIIVVAKKAVRTDLSFQEVSADLYPLFESIFRSYLLT